MKAVLELNCLRMSTGSLPWKYQATLRAAVAKDNRFPSVINRALVERAPLEWGLLSGPKSPFAREVDDGEAMSHR